MASSLPPGPRGRLWNTLQVMRDPYGTYARCRDRYGDTFLLRAVNGDIWCSADPAFVRDLLKATSEQIRPFGVDVAAPLLGRQGLLLLHGEAHREERKLLTPPFHGRRMSRYDQAILRIAEQTVGRWPDGGEVVASDEMLDISFRVIVQAVFGVVDEGDVERWVSGVQALVASLHPALLFAPMLRVAPLGLGPWARFQRAHAALDAMLYARIASARQSGERGDDILSLMLDATYEDGSAMTDVQVRDELVALLFAGHETTQIAMAWALYRLARHPAAMERLQAEVDGCDGSPEALAALPWLDAVVSETLRLEPIVPDMIRTLEQPMQLGGWAVPAGAHVGFLAALIHTREDLYPEPAAFRPERFLERTFKPHEYVPFGGGVRRCIGAALAVYEMKVVLGTVLRSVEVESLHEERPVRRSVTMGPGSGVRLRVRRRESPRVARAGY